jgi:hypothetical protein
MPASWQSRTTEFVTAADVSSRAASGDGWMSVTLAKQRWPDMLRAFGLTGKTSYQRRRNSLNNCGPIFCCSREMPTMAIRFCAKKAWIVSSDTFGADIRCLQANRICCDERRGKVCDEETTNPRVLKPSTLGRFSARLKPCPYGSCMWRRCLVLQPAGRKPALHACNRHL